MMLSARCRVCTHEYGPTQRQIRKHDWICRTCRNAKDQVWRARRKAEGRPVIPTDMPVEYHRAYNAKYYAQPEKRERRNANARTYRSREDVRPKALARLAVRNALRRGELHKEPCARCGASRVEAHHCDYSQPLVVAWLCADHHRQEHQKAEGR